MTCIQLSVLRSSTRNFWTKDCRPRCTSMDGQKPTLNALLDLIRASGAKAHIPSTSQRLVHRSVDRCIYRQRNLVERFFCKLKHFRRVATRFDKLARNFLAAVALASTRLWTRAYESTT